MSDSPAARGRADLIPLLGKITEGEDLTIAEAETAFDAFMDGSASEIQMAALLAGLRTKGVVPAEVAGGVRALRKAMVPVSASDPDSLVDTAGTGGGSVTTFNISTAAALVAAAAGVRMAKHGNRSFTSQCGSADVLEALGVRIDLTPERMGAILDQVGIVFMFAPLLHPAMRWVAPVRRGLGLTPIMNILGPLTNPASARRQVVGVADPHLVSLIVQSLEALGHVRAVVVHGSPGMDELSPTGPTYVAELVDGRVSEREVTPASLGLEPHPLEGLRGGTPADNAALVLRVLEGKEGGGPRSAVVMNAGAAIYVSGRSGSLRDAVGEAAEALGSGAALRTLHALADASHA